MFKEAVLAGFPLIQVLTDDPATFPDAAGSILGSPVTLHLYSAANLKDSKVKVMYTFKHEPDSVEIRNLGMNKKTLILVNYEGKNPSAFDVGTLPTPKTLMGKGFLQHESVDGRANILKAVDGLSYTSAKRVYLLAKHRGTQSTYSAYKSIRTELYGLDEGLYPLPTDDELYEWPQELREWADLNLPYLTEGYVSLAPRGILAYGPAGTGKSMLAKVLGREMNVPVYRLDIAASMTKWQGESEARVRSHLTYVEKESPCVLLIDEVEKIFMGTDDSGSSKRILSQLLWWLAEHKGRVLTVLTSNDITKLPKELFREGRIDISTEIHPLSPQAAQKLAKDWINAFCKANGITIKPTFATDCKTYVEGRITEQTTGAKAVSIAKQALKQFTKQA